MPKVTKQDLDVHPRLWAEDLPRYSAIADAYIEQYPDAYFGYSCRSSLWAKKDRLDLALADRDKAIALAPHWIDYHDRGDLLQRMGRFSDAIAALDQSEAMAGDEEWSHLGLLYRAHCHAALGNEEAALADCARLPDDFWTPGLDGDTPPGGKQDVIDEIKRRARAAKGTNGL